MAAARVVVAVPAFIFDERLLLTTTMRLFGLLTDGGRSDPVTDDAHYECRECGTNVDPGTDACPQCGGGVAVYTL
jgi:hypothetical protein